MVEVLTEKNKEVFYDYFNINTKKFTRTRILLCVLFILLYSVFVNFIGLTDNGYWWLIGIPICGLIGYKMPYMELVSKRNKLVLTRQYMFPNFLRYFISLLSTEGNVYLTIKETLNYVDEPFRPIVEKLIKELDDPRIPNYEAFMNFAEEIDTSESIMIMNMINDFSEQGINKDEIKELEDTILRLQENKVNELIEYKVGKIHKYANPIVVLAIVYMIVFVGIVAVAYLGMMNVSASS